MRSGASRDFGSGQGDAEIVPLTDLPRLRECRPKRSGGQHSRQSGHARFADSSPSTVRPQGRPGTSLREVGKLINQTQPAKSSNAPRGHGRYTAPSPRASRRRRYRALYQGIRPRSSARRNKTGHHPPDQGARSLREKRDRFRPRAALPAARFADAGAATRPRRAGNREIARERQQSARRIDVSRRAGFRCAGSDRGEERQRSMRAPGKLIEEWARNEEDLRGRRARAFFFFSKGCANQGSPHRSIRLPFLEPDCRRSRSRIEDNGEGEFEMAMRPPRNHYGFLPGHRRRPPTRFKRGERAITTTHVCGRRRRPSPLLPRFHLL